MKFSSEKNKTAPKKLRPALFLDRDGTLMEEVDHCHRAEDVRAIQGVADKLAEARLQGWVNIIITNQSGIGRGYFTEKEFFVVQEELQRQLNGLIDASYMAPDLPDTGSLRRKPAPGMILEAAVEHQIDLSRSFMIGDRAGDIGCGRAAGCQTILVLTGYGKEHQDCDADFIAENVTEAIQIALEATP